MVSGTLPTTSGDEVAAQAVVVGAGVVGLTTALALAEDGWSVRVRTAEAPPATTSAVAAAVWFPYLVGPADAVDRWGRATAEELARLAARPDAPVTARTVNELLRAPAADPGWRRDLPAFTPIGSLPTWATGGWRWTSWVADMPAYLDWLVDRLGRHDVPIDVAPVAALADAASADTDLVVDCVGVEAARLVGDEAVTPVRGQVVLVAAPDVEEVWIDADDPDGTTYVIPRTDVVVCGGTAERGEWDRTPDTEVTAAILERTARLVPAIEGAPVVDVAVGLRPSRPEVRLEAEHTAHGPVLHHYGHGGAGLTLSWGAARAAVALARDAIG